MRSDNEKDWHASGCWSTVSHEKIADKLKREDVRGFKVYSVTFDDEILYITQSGAGEIRAAACTQLLISLFDIDLIVNYGVVGALTEELKVTNICLVEKVIHYDMDTSAADHCEVGRYLEYQDIYLPTTKKYVQLVIILETSQRFPMKITIGIYHKLS